MSPAGKPSREGRASVSDQLRRQLIARRDLLKVGGLSLIGAVGVLPRWSGPTLASIGPRRLEQLVGAGAPSPVPTRFVHLAASDGWISIPGSVSEGGTTYSPDPLAPPALTTYVFGFRDVTSLDAGRPDARQDDEQPKILAQKSQVQHSAPLLFFDEGDAIQITLDEPRPGRAAGPDRLAHDPLARLPERDAPVRRRAGDVDLRSDRADFPYYYHPTDPGTYMYHCHNEDVEHVQMGMDGIVFVRPAQNKTGSGAAARSPATTAARPALRSAMPTTTASRLSDPRSTAYDREFGDLPQRVLGPVALRRRAHPGERLERLPRRLLPDERPVVPGHARAERRRHRPARPAT